MMPDDTGFGPPRLARFNALFMIGCLAAGLVALVATGQSHRWPGSEHTILDGEWTGHYERGMDDQFATRDAAVALWASIEWTLFNQGRRGVVPGRDGWLFTVEEFEQPSDADREISRKVVQIVETRNSLSAAGVDRLIIALLPDKSRIYADRLDGIERRPIHAARYQAFRDALIRSGLTAPDLLGALADARASGLQTHMRTDTHWTPAGAAVVAQSVAADVHAMDNPPPSLRSSTFETHDESDTTHDGDLMRYIPLGVMRGWLWGDPEPLSLRSTVAVDASTDDSASLLFDDLAIPVVLIGTSYSAMDAWNFEGALKQALGMDVLNLADEGQGPMAPMAAYLVSDALADNPPELVIWEIPERFLPVSFDLPADALRTMPE